MKALRYIFAAIVAVALVAVLLGYTWHLGSLAVCATMFLALKEDEDDSTGWR